MVFLEKPIYRVRLPKKGAWKVCRFKEGGLGQKERGVFEGVHAPMCTMIIEIIPLNVYELIKSYIFS